MTCNWYREHMEGDRKHYKKSRFRKKTKRFEKRYAKALNEMYPNDGLIKEAIKSLLSSGG